jgi:putative transposase
MCYLARRMNNTKLHSNTRLNRWILRLLPYDFEVIHRKGTKHCDVDCVSRWPLPFDPEKEPPDIPIFSIITTPEWREAQESDEWCQSLYQKLPDKTTRPRGRFTKKNDLWCLEQPTINGPRYRVCVPNKLRWAAVAMVHDSPDGGGHFGRRKTLEKLEARFYWPTLRPDLNEYIKTCRECQFSNRRQHRHLGPM